MSHKFELIGSVITDTKCNMSGV